jgi:hypothetical protein
MITLINNTINNFSVYNGLSQGTSGTSGVLIEDLTGRKFDVTLTINYSNSYYTNYLIDLTTIDTVNVFYNLKIDNIYSERVKIINEEYIISSTSGTSGGWSNIVSDSDFTVIDL